MTHRLSRSLLAALVVLISVGAALVGLGSQALNLVVLGAVVMGIVDRLWGLRRRDIVLAPWKKQEGVPWRAHRWQLGLRVVFGLLWATTLVSLLRVLPVFGSDARVGFAAAFGVTLLLWLVLALFPRRRVDLAHNVALGLATTTLMFAWLPAALPPPAPVALTLPVHGELAVLQGGPTPIMNHHYLLARQRHALDLLWLEGGQAVDPDTGEAVGFQQPVLAPAAGEVVTVVDGLPDGELRPAEPAGNHIVIAMADGRYVLLAHLEDESISVEEGDRVTAGQHIAALGNSGNSSMAHLHLQVQDGPTLSASTKTFPIRFDDAAEPERLPQRGDVVRPRQRAPRAVESVAHSFRRGRPRSPIRLSVRSSRHRR